MLLSDNRAIHSASGRIRPLRPLITGSRECRKHYRNSSRYGWPRLGGFARKAARFSFGCRQGMVPNSAASILTSAEPPSRSCRFSDSSATVKGVGRYHEGTKTSMRALLSYSSRSPSLEKHGLSGLFAWTRKAVPV
jgi:hypothetical protein